MILKDNSDKYDELFYICEYHPYWTWEYGEKVRNSSFDHNSSLILDFKKNYPGAIEWFQNTIAGLIGNDFPVCVVPSHEASVDNSNSSTATLAKGLVKSNNLIDATNCVQRFRTIQKLANGGDRNLEVHVNSIHIVNPELIEGKTILLLDDVMTTGNSLRACRKLLLDAGAENVFCLALAQTVR